MVKFQRARRESIGLLIGCAGPSGGGKTYTAMELATGLADGKAFAVIDTEAGRAKHYADQFTFDHADITAPFRPDTYLEAIEAADEAGYPVIVVDSMSHEHAGDGGLLDWHEEELERMAGNDWAKRERVKFAAWIKPKSAHKRMVAKLLQVRAHLILCFRAEQKTEMPKKGERELRPKRLLSGFVDWIPITEKNLLFELTTSFLLLPDHPGVPIPIKIEAQHLPFFPKDHPIGRKTGEQLAAWARGDSSGADASGGISEPKARPGSHKPPGRTPAPDCPECSAAGREQCSIHAGSGGGDSRGQEQPGKVSGSPPSGPLPKQVLEAIQDRVSRLPDADHPDATEELQARARAALRLGKSADAICKAISEWKPTPA